MEPSLNPQDKRKQILSILKTRGPSLPIHIAKETGLSVLFASAFLSELSSMKEVKISNMKVGGSPLYYLPGQELSLENFSHYLSGKERESYLLLKEKKVLEDRSQDPAIRVALRSLRDFVIPLVIRDNEEQKLFWVYFSVQEDEARNLINTRHIQKIPLPQAIIQKETKPQLKQELTVEKKQDSPEIIKQKPKLKIPEKAIKTKQMQIKLPAEKPLLRLKQKEEKKPREKSSFVQQTIEKFILENIEIIEEKEHKKKEYFAVIRINSDLGKLKFLAICKDKKKVTENDLALAVQKSQALKLPVLFCSPGSLDNKAEKYLENYAGLVKFKVI